MELIGMIVIAKFKLIYAFLGEMQDGRLLKGEGFEVGSPKAECGRRKAECRRWKSECGKMKKAQGVRRQGRFQLIMAEFGFPFSLELSAPFSSPSGHHSFPAFWHPRLPAYFT